MKHQYQGIRRIFEAFKNSFDGLKYIFREEEAFRQDLLLCFVLFVVVYFLPVLKVEKILLNLWFYAV